MKKILLLLICLMSLSTICFAETKEIIVEGTYTAGDNDTIKSAEDMALNNAKRAALEQFGVNIESTTEVKNMQLTQDKIQTFASGNLQTTILDKKRIVNSDGTISFWVKVKCIKLEEVKKEPIWKLICSYNVPINISNPVNYIYLDTASSFHDKSNNLIDCWIKTNEAIGSTTIEHILINMDNFSYKRLELSSYDPFGFLIMHKIYDNTTINVVKEGSPMHKAFIRINFVITTPEKFD